MLSNATVGKAERRVMTHRLTNDARPTRSAKPGLELHDRAQLIHASDKNRLRLIVRRGAEVQPAYRVHGRPVQRIEEVNLRLDAEALQFERLADVHIQLVDPIAELGIRRNHWHR